MKEFESSPYLYEELFDLLWKDISQALLLCVDYKLNNELDKLTETNKDLIDCFNRLDEIRYKCDAHIIEGLLESHQKRLKIYPRVLKLTLLAFDDAQKVKATSGFLIPSPLNIIYHLFIVPENSYTAAYAITTCKYFLFNVLQLFPSNSIDKESNQLKRLFEETDVMEALSDFEGFAKIHNRWPKDVAKGTQSINSKISASEIKSFVGHFLATKGISHLWFEDIDKAQSFLSLNDKKKFIDQLRVKIKDVRFRVSAKYNALPDWGEIINQIFGYPVPIKGADTVLCGGLKPSSNGGLIISISGRAGVGKTSFALALVDSFSPFGTECLYISLEEEEEDIKKRLGTIRPHADKKLQFFSKSNDWFTCGKYEGTVPLDIFTEEIEEIGKELNLVVSNTKKETHGIAFPPVCPYIIVVDNITELFSDFESDHYAQIEDFIQKCRRLNAIVLLLSPEGMVEKLKIEYLVDVGIELKHKDLDKDDEKPVRIFNLYKTRHQQSRQGAHIFHLTGREGFRISPQIPSQMDRKEKFVRHLHDDSKLIHTLNFICESSTVQEKPLSKEKNRIDSYLNLYPRTNILIHGFGSAGKAGFALKLLLTPPIDASLSTKQISSNRYDHLKYRRNILIISFLYSEDYYRGLISGKKNLQAKLENIYAGLADPFIEYLVLYPGYLTPQDFLNKVTRKLDEATLKGLPFTGVLIDGLHNVFLQFEKLQDSNMVWPMLYNILSRYDLTVVSTFTNFSLNEKLVEANSKDKYQFAAQTISDQMLLQKGMAPFLHALVKASDYYFFMEQETYKGGKKGYLLGVKGAIDAVPEELLEWDREQNVFKAIYTLDEINEKVNKKQS